MEKPASVYVRRPTGNTPPDAVYELTAGGATARLTVEQWLDVVKVGLLFLPLACRMTGRQVPQLVVTEIHPSRPVEPPLESVL